jgi:hypothetical protein
MEFIAVANIQQAPAKRASLRGYLGRPAGGTTWCCHPDFLSRADAISAVVTPNDEVSKTKVAEPDAIRRLIQVVARD